MIKLILLVALQTRTADASDDQWLEAIICLKGGELTLVCPWKNQLIILSWWKTGVDHVPKKVPGRVEFAVERADHGDSGMYECFNSMGNNQPYEHFKRHVLIIEYTCRKLPNRTTFEIVHSMFPNVDLPVRRRCNGEQIHPPESTTTITASMTSSAAITTTMTTTAHGRMKVVTVDLFRSGEEEDEEDDDDCLRDTSIDIGEKIVATCGVGGPEALVAAPPTTLALMQTGKTELGGSGRWDGRGRGRESSTRPDEPDLRSLWIVIPTLVSCALLTLLLLLVACQFKNHRRWRKRNEKLAFREDDYDETHYEKLNPNDLKIADYEEIHVVVAGLKGEREKRNDHVIPE